MVSRAPLPEKKVSRAGITMVATARAAALAVSAQPKDCDPILLVPTPQKNMAGMARTYLANVRLVFWRVVISHQLGLDLFLVDTTVIIVNARP